MADLLFNASKWGKSLDSAFGGRKPTIATLGDSLGEKLAGAGILYCLEALYPADVIFDRRLPASGGRNFGESASQTSALAGQTALFAANPADVAFICNRPNDTLTTHANAVSSAGNIITAANACIAAGASLVVIHGSSPRGTIAQTPSAYREYDTLLMAFAAVTPGVVYVDVAAALGNPGQTSTTQMQWLNNAVGTAGAMTHDESHPSREAIRVAIAPLYEPILRRIARPRVLRANFPTGVQWHETNFPNEDMLKDSGLMLGTGGQLANVANVNVPGSTGAVWDIGNGGNGIVVTPSIVTGADGWKRMRVALSGTLTGDSYVTFDMETSLSITAQSGRHFDFEAKVELTNLTGFRNHQIVCTALQTVPTVWSTSNPSHVFPAGFTDEYFMYHPWPNEISGSNPEFRLQFYFANGSVLDGGTIGISRASVRKIS